MPDREVGCFHLGYLPALELFFCVRLLAEIGVPKHNGQMRDSNEIFWFPSPYGDMCS